MKQYYAIKGYSYGRTFPVFYDCLPTLKIARQWIASMKSDGFNSYELYKNTARQGSIGVTRELIEEANFN